MYGGIGTAFRPFVTTRLRQESHGVLARELLLAVRKGLPLDEALEAFTKAENRVPRLFWNVMLFLLLLIPPAMGLVTGWVGLAFAVFLAFIVFFTIGGATQSDQYRRYVGAMLCRELRRGRTLGEAFREHGELFDSFETTLMEAGEGAGQLDKSLTAWSRHAESSERLGHTADMAIYPAVVAALVLSGLFLLMRLMTPKYENIWEVLAGTSYNTSVMRTVIDTLRYLASPGLISIVLFLCSSVVLAVFPRRFFNGSVTGSLLFVTFCFVYYVLLFWACLGIAGFDLDDMDPGGVPLVGAWATIPASVFVAAFFTLIVFRGGRWLAGKATDRVLTLMRWIPALRRADHRLSESRFLFALGSLLGGGVEWPEAFAHAGRAAGRARWEQAGAEASALARRGRSPDEIFRSLYVLAPATRSALTIGEFDGRLLESLEEIAAEDHRLGEQDLSRFNAVFFPLTHLLVGASVAIFLILLYCPVLLLSTAMPYTSG